VIVAGIGLLSMHNWARWLCVGYAVLAILLHCGYTVYEQAILLPAQEEWGSQIAVQQPAQPAGFQQGFSTGYQAGARVGAILRPALFIFHAFPLLPVMLLPNVGAAFARRTRRRLDDDERPTRRRRRYREEDEEEEEDEPRFRRRRRSEWDDED